MNNIKTVDMNPNRAYNKDSLYGDVKSMSK